MQKIATADLWDDHGDQLQLMQPGMFKGFGLEQSFHGPAHTLKVFEDNSLVRKALEEDGKGKVLVVDGGGSLRCALMGDKLATLMIENNWAGAIVYGAIRDAAVINGMEAGLYALGTCPVKSIKRGEGRKGETLGFGGLSISPGDYIYADEDGILKSRIDLTSE